MLFGNRRRELIAATMLLTRLPVAQWAEFDSGSDQTPGHAARVLAAGVWAFPIIGAVVGLLGGMVAWGSRMLGLPPSIAALWALVAMALLTGGLHEDGLADTADGFGGGRTRERRLDIMRDSRIGSYGALALILITVLRAAAIAALPAPRLLPDLSVALSLSRAGMIPLMTALPPARPDGLAAAIDRPRPGLCLAVVSVTALAAVLLAGKRGAAAGMLACMTVALLGRAARRMIGGQTGDVLGCTAMLVETVALSVLACG